MVLPEQLSFAQASTTCTEKNIPVCLADNMHTDQTDKISQLTATHLAQP